MSTVFIFHGAFGHPEENWFPWLRNTLEAKGHTVSVPLLPTPDHAPLEEQTLENWLQAFEPYRKYLTADTILIGHSLAAPFILRILETISHPLKASFLIAGVSKGAPKKFQTETFTAEPFDFEKIKKNCQYFTVFHGDDDPYNSLETAEKRAEELSAELIVIPQGGHLNAAAGYTTFPALLEKIQKISETH